MVVLKISLLVGYKWVLLAQKGQQNGQMNPKCEQNDEAGINVNIIIRKVYKKGKKKLLNQLK